ncbi:MAG: hypothetical protein G01um101429_1015 [Parcubacteria group bacterium Gr01-1014_29]|nr:MAG: hypothetical protein G01um101429_1015 [Parcubacteria group bacterium Gr01-1014_29]
MLSAVIHSRLSYPALPLAGQLVDQRSVLSGPLVAFSIISNGADYIFTPQLRGSACYSNQCPIYYEIILLSSPSAKPGIQSLRGQIQQPIYFFFCLLSFRNIICVLNSKKTFCQNSSISFCKMLYTFFT